MNQQVEAMTKAIAYAENGGAPDIDNPIAGKTGELKSIFQFTPNTWKNYAKQTFGDENTVLNADNETYVVMNKVKGWLDEGYKPEQIASMWNAGTGEPNAYTGKFSNGKPSVGVNKKYNVKFNVPEYTQKVLKYYNQFNGGKQSFDNKNQSVSSDPANKLLSLLSGAGKTSAIQPQTTSTPLQKDKDNVGMLLQLLNR